MFAEIPDWIVREAVRRALEEDIGAGDITTLATVDASARCEAEIVAKSQGVAAGLPVARAVFGELDDRIHFAPHLSDGDQVAPATTIATMEGLTRAVLTGERTALNFLQRMSGIATLTAQYVAAVKGTKARICDTRKTAPGLRVLDKYAVAIGGGHNHRLGLYDGILIKDNHIRAAGGVREAASATGRASPGQNRS